MVLNNLRENFLVTLLYGLTMNFKVWLKCLREDDYHSQAVLALEECRPLLPKASLLGCSHRPQGLSIFHQTLLGCVQEVRRDECCKYTHQGGSEQV